MSKQAKPSKIPYFFFVFFGVIIVVNIAYIYVAQKSWRGVVMQDSYQKGVDYNDVISQKKKQINLAWKVVTNYKRLDEKNGELRVKLSDKNSILIKDANIRANFRRPTQDGFDFNVPLVFMDGVYQAKVSFPLKGQWDIELVITRGEETFQEVKRYVIQ